MIFDHVREVAPLLIRRAVVLWLSCAVVGCLPNISAEKKRGAEIASYDDELVALSTLVKGFGGMYFDASGNLNVYLTPLEMLEASRATELAKSRVKAALTRVFGEDVSMRYKNKAANVTPTIQFISGQYTTAQLAEYRDQVVQALEQMDATYIDLDEGRNRVTIGIAAESMRAKVAAAIDLAKLPQDAIRIVVSPVAKDFNTLTSYQRPILGGLAIASAKGKYCTLGFNARHTQGANGFITASHCTDQRGGLEDTLFYQPDALADGVTNKYVGREIKDPPAWACPTLLWISRQCRYSDAAFIAYDFGMTQVLADKLAVTPDLSNLYSHYMVGTSIVMKGSLEIIPSDTLTLRNNTASRRAVQGDVVGKLGAYGGFSVGQVAETCVTQRTNQQNLVYLCQTRVTKLPNAAYHSELFKPGDSGAVVFAASADALLFDNVQLKGIAWGYIDEHTYVYSSEDLVRAELEGFTIEVQ